jgi:class 3 adenylate cyclase/tetratricopeptide (TPR) repeat protein
VQLTDNQYIKNRFTKQALRCTALLIWLLTSSHLVYSQKKADIDSLLNKLEDALKADTLQVKILNQLCWQHRNNEFEKAIDYGKKSIALALKIKDFRGLSEAYNFVGVVHRNLGDYGESNRYFFEALKIAEKYLIKTQQGYAYNNIADALKLQKKYLEAIPFSDKALAIFQEINDKRGLAFVYIRLGEIYQSIKKYDEALGAFIKSKDIREELKEKSNLITSYTRLGLLYKVKNELDTGLDYFLKALKLSESMSDKRAIAGCYDFIASIYIAKKDLNTAKRYAEQSLNLALSINARIDEKNAYFTLAQIYEQEGKYAASLLYHKKFLTLNDSIASLEKSTQLTKMQVIYDNKKKEKENELLKKENEIHERDQEVKNLILGLISVLLLCTLGGIYLVYRSRQKHIRLRADIEAKNIEILRKKTKLENNISILLELSKDEAIANGSWQTLAEKVPKSVVEALNVSGCELWYYNYHQKVFYCIGRHHIQKTSSTNMTQVSVEQNPYFLDVLSKDNPITIENIFQTEVLDEVSRQYFIQQNQKALILYPSILSEKQKGILLCFQESTHAWELEDLIFMKSMDDEINIAYQGFRRKQAQEQIEKQNIEIAKKNETLRTTLKLVKTEQKRTDELLLNILPLETAEELKSTGKATPKYYKLVSVLFTDFKGFTQITEKLSPQEVIEELNRCFLAFDEICERHELEKIKTIGDSYMCVGGLPVANTSNPADCVAAALEMQAWMEDWKAEKLANGKQAWEVRIGIHSGEVIAGVIGKNKFAYDVWGDTVNLASRMESAGEVGKINISESTYELVKDRFECEYRGKIQAKNKGEVSMYFVNGTKA